MDRRKFTQLFTFAGASLPLLQVAAEDENGNRAQPSSESQSDETAVSGKSGEPLTGEPVNVADFRALAEAKLTKATFDYIATGSADGITLRENIAAFRRMKVLPPLLKGVSQPDLSTIVLKQKVSLPIMLAPVAAQRMYHSQGALAAARAAESAGTVFGVSSSAGNSVEEIARESKGPKWFQLYVPNDRAVARQLVRRVERAGYKAIIVTVDLGEWKDADRRNRFMLPKEMLVKHLQDVGFQQVTDAMSYEDVIAFNAQAWDLSLSWDFFGWLRSITKLPLLIKGVLRKEDAQKAVSLGLDGIVVSNHGGRRLDGMPASIDMLPDIVEAVAGRAEVYMDGGIRRGTDVLKALALGAKAVLIGRPYAWALGADGEAGVKKVIELLRAELLNAMIATGTSKTSNVDRSIVLTEK
jgi:isopentenyl diphosphate isomerase/L-lactate dehydrogenase-like FMN-dependent dehydrogenase